MALTVSIAINGHPLYTRTVVNRLAECGYYVSDDGRYIKHDPNDGAVALAIKALQTIEDNADGQAQKINEVISVLDAEKLPNDIGLIVARETLRRRGVNDYDDKCVIAAIRERYRRR